jgi:hypothetical protein
LAFRLNDPLEKVDSALQLQRSSCVYRAAGAMSCEERLPQRHEHNLLLLLQYRNPPSHCKAVLLPQDAFMPLCSRPMQHGTAQQLEAASLRSPLATTQR